MVLTDTLKHGYAAEARKHNVHLHHNYTEGVAWAAGQQSNNSTGALFVSLLEVFTHWIYCSTECRSLVIWLVLRAKYTTTVVTCLKHRKIDMKSKNRSCVAFMTQSAIKHGWKALQKQCRRVSWKRAFSLKIQMDGIIKIIWNWYPIPTSRLHHKTQVVLQSIIIKRLFPTSFQSQIKHLKCFCFLLS